MRLVSLPSSASVEFPALPKPPTFTVCVSCGLLRLDPRPPPICGRSRSSPSFSSSSSPSSTSTSSSKSTGARLSMRLRSPGSPWFAISSSVRFSRPPGWMSAMTGSSWRLSMRRRSPGSPWLAISSSVRLSEGPGVMLAISWRCEVSAFCVHVDAPCRDVMGSL